jgi:ATP-dependent Lhr-like helicase
LEAQLAKRRRAAAPRVRQSRRKPSPSHYKAAQKRVRQRLTNPALPYVKPARWVGRWTLVHRFGVLGKAVEMAERTAQQARQLLARYGVVTRACLADEIGAWEWSPIYQQLKRMEMRGEVRRGYFIQGLPGLQFAVPEAVERLRATRNIDKADLPLVVMNACDPANLYGPARDDLPLTQDGEPLAFSRVPSTWLVLHRGLPILIARDNCANLLTVEGADEAIMQQGLNALLGHLSRFENRVTVQQWNGGSVLGSPGQMLLERAGFYRDYPGMAWERT